MQNMEIKDPGQSRQFILGQRLEALVLSKEGDDYLLQSGAKLFRAKSDLTLPVGAKLFLYVSEQTDNRTLLKIELPAKNEMPNLIEQEQVLERVRLLAAKYGFMGEKEIGQLAEQLAKLPVDEKTGVRYLLDPHLATAVIITDQLRPNHQAKIEIEQYKQVAGNQRVWEVNLDVNLTQLGSVEIIIKMIDGRIYARIWAEQAETEALLRARQGDLDLQIFLVEIVPVTVGPLIPRETKENIDMRV